MFMAFQGSAYLDSAFLRAIRITAAPTISRPPTTYRIVVPKKRPLGVQNALEQAGKELASALKEGAGLDVEVVWSSDFKGAMRKSPVIFLGAGAAEKAGVMPADLKGFENVIAEKGGNVYLFGRDVQRLPKE